LSLLEVETREPREIHDVAAGLRSLLDTLADSFDCLELLLVLVFWVCADLGDIEPQRVGYLFVNCQLLEDFDF